MSTTAPNAIDQIIDDVARSVGGIRKPYDGNHLRALHVEKKYAQMAAEIMNHLRLDMQLRLGLVNSAPGKQPAWINLPTPMPPYGTTAFRNLTLTMYARKSFLARVPFETTVLMFAHELTHIVLDAVGSSHHRNEKAVDLGVMVLGFLHYYEKGYVYEVQSSIVTDSGERAWHKYLPAFLVPLVQKEVVRTSFHKERAGYLSHSDVAHASSIIKKMSAHYRRP